MNEAGEPNPSGIRIRLLDYSVLRELVDFVLEGKPISKQYPRWVQRAGARFIRATFSPTTELLQKRYKRSHHVGHAAGLMMGLDKYLAEFAEKLPQPKEPPTTEQMENAWKQFMDLLYGTEPATLTGDSIISLELQKEIGEQIATVPTAEMELFYRGGEFAAKIFVGKNKANDATDIYMFMMLSWQLIEHLKSIEHLHEMLTKIFGHNRIGPDVARTRKICHRIGKRFRPPGRPKTTPDSQTT